MLSEYLQGMDGEGRSLDSIKFDAVVVPMPDDLASLFADASCNMGQLLERDNFVCMMQMAGDGELGHEVVGQVAMAWVWAMKKQTWNPDGPGHGELPRIYGAANSRNGVFGSCSSRST